jgi:hypothetical protein
MKITVTSYDSETDSETFDSLDALRQDLACTAADVYTEAVMRHIRAGRTFFMVPNGAFGSDTWTVER